MQSVNWGDEQNDNISGFFTHHQSISKLRHFNFT